MANKICVLIDKYLSPLTQEGHLVKDKIKIDMRKADRIEMLELSKVLLQLSRLLAVRGYRLQIRKSVLPNLPIIQNS